METKGISSPEVIPDGGMADPWTRPSRHDDHIRSPRARIIEDTPLRPYAVNKVSCHRYPGRSSGYGRTGTPNKEGTSGKDAPQASCRDYGRLITPAWLQDRKGMGIYQRGFSGGKRLHVATDQLNVIPTITFVGQHLEFKHGHGYCSSIHCSNRQRLFSLTYSTSG